MVNKLILFVGFTLLVLMVKAQTGGPGQPEFMQFKQAGTSNLVNLSTGSFTYQVPLFTIGGYPMNLSYQSGIQMEDAASMVGLGWNLNAGSIVRTLRGLPDDFNGDKLIKQYSVKPNETFGGKLGVDLEIAGLPMGLSVGASMGVFYNNYKGWGLEPSLSGSISMSAKVSEGVGGSASLGMGISANSQSGVDKYLSPSIGLKLGSGNDKLGISLGKTWSVNSNEGLKINTNASLSYNRYSLGYSHTSYLNNSFQPDINYPFENSSGTYSAAVGFDGFYVDPNIRVTGYFSKQKLATTSQQFSAFGSMYESSSISGSSLMDYNTEKKLPFFIGESKILPVPYKTPDVFNLNAQGISMSFSILKNDIGLVGDAAALVNSNGSQGGAEVNLGQLFKAGANFGTTNSFQQTGKWNPANTQFKPDQDVISNQLYQQFVFKNHSEINKFNHAQFTDLGGYDPIKFNLADEASITQQLSNGSSLPAAFINSNQVVRQSTINYLTAKEAEKIGFDKTIKYYSFNGGGEFSLNRVSDYRKNDHLSELSVTQPDGMKYVFGIPAYNSTQKEVSFNVGTGALINSAKNLVSYTPNVDNTTSNTKGIDQFFEATTTPAYVTQFLITAVLSPGYRDLTNDGITDDDLGNYVKFSYYKETFNYNWRTPVAQNMATYNKALRSDDTDDKGSYVYGEKELWYVRYIQSKTEIAELFYFKRNDSFGVNDENGGKNANNYLRGLEKVVIYSLPDRIKNGINAIPTRTINFDYNYTLCENIENGNAPATGKLTLKQLDITYERSKKGKLSPYVFAYGERSAIETINPSYESRSVNRWGYYQKNEQNNYSDIDNSALSNIDNPYALQSKPVMDKNAYAWNLTNITIPGGGKLKVDYEANDYAYIQDKTAGQMFKISGVTSPSSIAITGTKLYDTDLLKNRVYFKLTAPISISNPVQARKQLEEEYIKDIKDGYLYYKIYVRLTAAKYEYVTGYAKIKDYGLSNNGLDGYIDLQPTQLTDDLPLPKVSPMLRTALQYMRINRNNLMFDNTAMGTPANFDAFINSLPSIHSQLVNQIAASTVGVNIYGLSKFFCQEIDTAKSFIRLYNPMRMKIAGGSRVKQVSIDDNWNTMTGNTNMSKSYNTTYDYTSTVTDLVTNISSTISSGVADYEPMIGGDEISLKQPIFYSDIKRMAPDNDYYVEDPINESLFPAPQITYGKVTQITNGTNQNVGHTGKIVNEFFTAKDFPVKVNRTVIDVARDKSNPGIFQPPFVAINQQHDHAAVSQGYSIELNNMSGLPKATWIYNQNGDRISGEENTYFPDNDHFTLIDRKGTIKSNKQLGLSAEYTIEGKKSLDESVSTSFSANLNLSIFGIVTIPIIMPLYSKMTETKQFQSLAFNKVIHRNGLLQRKTVYEQSSSITTENLAFDEVTGEALLTKTTNEFNDSLFLFKYPAYWMYEGMGPASANTKLKVNASNLQAVTPFLKAGDELQSTATGQRLWVKSTATSFFESDFGAQAAFTGTDYQVVNSGAKNLLTATAGQVSTWKMNPLQNGNKITFGTTNILNSSVTTYDDAAVMYCDSCLTLQNRFGKSDFLTGKKGNFKPKQTWFYLEERTPGNLVNGVTNIKEQGLFKTYHDFWGVPVNPVSNWTINNTGWEWKEKVNLVDVDGQVIETEDRLGRKTANLLGYKNTLITAQANNSAYGEAYFDGFEDYFCSHCEFKNPNQADRTRSSSSATTNTMKRVNITSGNLIITTAESHTGKYSLSVPGSLTFTIFPPVNCKESDGPSSTNDTDSKRDQRTAITIPRVTPRKKCSTCAGGFSPQNGTKYIFSCWVKVNNTQPILSNSDASVTITPTGSSSVILKSEGPVIEGWQRVMGTFSTSSNSNAVSIKLNKGNAATFFDDLRIFPEKGNMVSYVYDDVNLRLTYSLDANNYFTKNEYNSEGELIRVKKETERGIVTVKESHSSLVKLK